MQKVYDTMNTFFRRKDEDSLINNILWNKELNEKIASSDKGIILYGAGLNAVRVLISLKRSNYSNVQIICIADADKSKQGGQIFDIPIVAPDEISKYSPDTYIVVTTLGYCISIADTLNKLGFFNIIWQDEWSPIVLDAIAKINAYTEKNRKSLDRLLDENASAISHVRESLCHDKRSLAVFDAKLNSNFYCKHLALDSLIDRDEYYPADIIKLTENEVFVDGGAFDGRTAIEFAHKSKEYGYIYSFEPDPWQYALTEKELAFQRIERCEVFNLGLFDCEGELSFSSVDNQGSNINEDGDIKVRITSLDTLLYDRPDRPSFIKLDIEGAELEALKGAYKIIERDHPKLVICVYHKLTDIWEIPYWINTNFPQYNLYFRQHGSLYNTICYAV